MATVTVLFTKALSPMPIFMSIIYINDNNKICGYRTSIKILAPSNGINDRDAVNGQNFSLYLKSISANQLSFIQMRLTQKRFSSGNYGTKTMGKANKIYVFRHGVE